MKPITWLFLALLLGWLLSMSYCHKIYCNCGSTGASSTTVVPATIDDTEPLKSIFIEDTDKNFSLSLYDNLVFDPSNCMYESPVSDSLTTIFQSLADHLSTNSDRILLLTGLYQNAETNNCNADDLGLARAESVRQLLVDKGASNSQIRLTSNDVNILDLVGDKIMGGIAYSFIDGDLTVVEQRLRESRITLYFETNNEDILLNPEQEQYFEDLKFLLAGNPDTKALVTGHTDDIGSTSSNRRLSKKRAEGVRDFMVNQGIAKAQIIARGEGPDEPIASNNTEEGRAENRRVEITVQ